MAPARPSAPRRASRRERTATATATADPVDSGDGGGNGDDPRGRLTVIPGGGDGEEPRSKPRLKKLRALLVIMGLSVLALVSWIFGIMMAVAQDLPKLENRAQYERAENSVVYDRDGNRLATLTNNEGRILVESDEIAPVMKEAVVAIEDQRFYDHRGVDFQGIARALYQDVLAGSAEQGASTITQQFVKNALAAQDSRTIFQKLREAALAYQLERNWSKDKIITEYLNSIYFGEGAYGIEAAARTFFGYAHEGCGQEGQPTCASELLPYEAALLAGIIASPDVYSPRANPENAEARRNLVLQNMASLGFITDEEYTPATRPALSPARARSSRRPTTPRPPTSRPGCASSWSTSTAPARPSAAAWRSSRRWTWSYRSRSSRSPRARWAASASTPPWSSSTTRPRASWPWSAGTTTRSPPSTWPRTGCANRALPSSRSRSSPPWSRGTPPARSTRRRPNRSRSGCASGRRAAPRW